MRAKNSTSFPSVLHLTPTNKNIRSKIALSRIIQPVLGGDGCRGPQLSSRSSQLGPSNHRPWHHLESGLGGIPQALELSTFLARAAAPHQRLGRKTIPVLIGTPKLSGDPYAFKLEAFHHNFFV